MLLRVNRYRLLYSLHGRQNSTYLIVNKKISNPDELSLIATDMFIDIHPELAGL